MATAAPQYIADTPEVQHATAQFAHAYNAAVQRNRVAPKPFAPADTELYEDGQTYPEAEPYVHEDIPAEPYVHIEPAHRRASAKTTAPVAPAAPVAQPPAPINFNFVPVAPVAQVAPVANRWGCYNWKGEGVQCRY